ncbi:MAG: HXXEE domain-containing protein [Alphaproteobacteria bacterium]|nr:HXXEE domain-containing protein [Alphaproteobacteria bacterium]
MSDYQYEYILWLNVMAYALHIIEEYAMDWRGWAENSLGFKGIEWGQFYVVNACAMVVAIAAAVIGWRLPEVSLAVPATFFINAVFFHLLPTLRMGVYSPGTATAVVLYLPVTVAAYILADMDGVLTLRVGVISFLLGAALMAFPVVLQRLRMRLSAP